MRILEHLDDRSQRILGVQLDDFRGLPRVQPDVRAQREHGELLDQALQYLRRERRFFLHDQLPDRFMREETLPVRTRVDERFEGSGESDDLGVLMNRLPLEPSRILLRASPFVLLNDYLRYPICACALPSERLAA